MKQRICDTCQQPHNLYYLIQRNNTRSMFFLCPKLKGREKVYTIFVSLVDGLDIPSYLSGTDSYQKLKDSVRADGEFTEEDRRIISLWRTARLVSRQMTREQIELIKRYVKGNPRW